MHREMGTRSGHIGKHTRRTTEDIIFQHDTLINRNIVLNPHPITHMNVGTNIDILSKRTIATKHSTMLHMTEMPYLGAVTYLYPVINI